MPTASLPEHPVKTPLNLQLDDYSHDGEVSIETDLSTHPVPPKRTHFITKHHPAVDRTHKAQAEASKPKHVPEDPLPEATLQIQLTPSTVPSPTHNGKFTPRVISKDEGDDRLRAWRQAHQNPADEAEIETLLSTDIRFKEHDTGAFHHKIKVATTPHSIVSTVQGDSFVELGAETEETATLSPDACLGLMARMAPNSQDPVSYNITNKGSPFAQVWMQIRSATEKDRSEYAARKAEQAAQGAANGDVPATPAAGFTYVGNMTVQFPFPAALNSKKRFTWNLSVIGGCENGGWIGGSEPGFGLPMFGQNTGIIVGASVQFGSSSPPKIGLVILIPKVTADPRVLTLTVLTLALTSSEPQPEAWH